MLNSFHLEQIICSPTRITDRSTTLIDHILVNSKDKISQSGVIPMGLSDHFITYCTRRTQKIKFNEHNVVTIRSQKNYNKDNFINLLKMADWSGIFESNNVNEAWDNFHKTFTTLLNVVAPIKTIRIKQRTEPYITSEILSEIKYRDQLLKDFKNDRQNGELYQKFCKQRNRLQRQIKSAKENYFAEKFQENKNDPKKLWKHLKNLGYSSKKKQCSNIVLNINEEKCYEPKSIANHFNNFFTSVASMLISKLPAPIKLYDFKSENFKKFYKNNDLIKLKLKTVSENFIYQELTKLNTAKSTGLDDIPARLLKDAAIVIKIPITYIVNLSIATDTVPEQLKKARVTPIYKKNERTEVSNYRPVSILSIVSKILEKAIYLQLEKHLNKNNLLYTLQSGFRHVSSTDTCLIHLTDHIKSQMSQGLYTGMALLDLQKAFDTVDHNILCEKLSSMGVISIKWFKSYLENRTQVVKVNKINSDILNINCGVPQGSILGPLLFLCYVNDMSMSISSDCKLILYADDTAILYSHKDPKIIENKLNEELSSCHSWLVDNKLSMHSGKTECILFGTKRRINKAEPFKLNINGCIIEAQKSVTYLGVIFDQTLSFEEAVNNIIKKANLRLKFLYRQGACMSENIRKTLCTALIQCHLDYCCSSWYSCLNKQFKKRLQIVQNKTVRFIKNLEPRTTVNQSVLADLKMLKVNDRVSQMRLNHVFKISNNEAPEYMYNNFISVTNQHHHYTRKSSLNYVVPQVNGILANTFYFNAIKDWNSLPADIQKLRTKKNFKNKVKSFLNNQAIGRENGEFLYY